jgi:hypothetical protein
MEILAMIIHVGVTVLVLVHLIHVMHNDSQALHSSLEGMPIFLPARKNPPQAITLHSKAADYLLGV